MTRYDEYRATARGALVENADVLYRHTLTFVLDPHEWENTRTTVKDPQKLKTDELGRLRMAADARGLPYADMRVVKCHPEDAEPFIGATTPWDDGTLQILEWSQVSDFTGTRVGTAVLRRP